MANACRQEPETSEDTALCAGHLVLWTWRKFVAGDYGCALLAREYESRAGDGAEDLLNAFGDFLVLLGRSSRRTLSVGRPLCVGVTLDEGQVLRLIAAAQGGDGALVTAHLSWLVRSGSVQTVRGALDRLAGLLSASGIVLPRVQSPAPCGSAMLRVAR